MFGRFFIYLIIDIIKREILDKLKKTLGYFSKSFDKCML